MRFVWISEKTLIFSSHIFNRLILITEGQCV